MRHGHQGTRLVAAAVVLLLFAFGTQAQTSTLKCDVDRDRDIDRSDLVVITAARNQPASGPDDPRDADNDGRITVLDGRVCALRCTLPGCAEPPAPGNRTPIANAGADQTVFTGLTVTLDGTASSDPDGNALTFRWQFQARPSGSAAALSSTSATRPTFLADQPGRYEIQLIVNDGTVDSPPDVVVVNTETMNTAPVADAGPDQPSAFVGIPVLLDGSGSSDVDGDTLSFAWTFISRPPGSVATLDDSAGVSPSFTPDLRGQFVVRLTVNDGRGGNSSDLVTVSTEGADRPPVANAGPDQSVQRGQLVQLSGSGTDPDLDPITAYSWSFVNRPVGSSANLSGATTATPVFTADRSGDFVIQLIVTANGVASAPDTVVITTGNVRPVAVAGPDQTTTVGSTVNLDGSASSDANNDPLAFLWSFVSRPAGSGATLSGSNTPFAAFLADVAGPFVLQLIVNDGELDSDPDSAIVTVNAPQNRPPVAANDSATTAEDDSVLINVLANDTDADADTLTLAFVSQPADGAAAIEGDSVRFTPTANFNGQTRFTYGISDGRGGESSATVTVSVTVVNDDPVANPDSASTAQETPVEIDVTSNDTDVDGDTRTVTAAGPAANGDVVIVNAATVRYTPNTGFAGIDTFQYAISDGNGGTATATVTVSVSATNRPPVASDDSAATEANTAVTIDVLANDRDPDNDPLTVSAVTQPATGGTVTIGAGGADVVFTPTDGFSGQATFAYTASDSRGDTDPATVTVTVSALPTISIDDLSIAEGDSGQTAAMLTVTLSRTSSQTVTVNFASADGTATVGSDYAAASDTLSFAPGVTSQNVTVQINGDALFENAETVLVNLSAPNHATVADDAQGVITITDDDATPTLSIANVSLVEGNTGSTDFVFTVTQSAVSGLATTVDFATADGTATSPSDYAAVTGSVTIPAGSTTGTATVTVNGDTVIEANETFFVNLSNAVNAIIGGGQAVGTIVSDDGTGGAPADQLPGAPTDPAAGIVPQLRVPNDTSSYALGHPDLPGIPRSTKIVRVAIDRNATVDQVNAMLTSAQARIIGGVPGVASAADALLVLELPTTSHAELDAARTLIESFTGVLRASPDVLLGGTVLPSSIPPSNWTWEVEPLGGNWGMEAMRVPQMWNLSELPPATLAPLVDVTVIDEGFENHGNIFGSYIPPILTSDHGNHVAGILGADFTRGIQGVSPFANMQMVSIATIADAITAFSFQLSMLPAPRVMNLSLGYNWYEWVPAVDPSTNLIAQFIADVDGLDVALTILAAVARGQPLPYIFAAAGNDSFKNGFGSQPAQFASPFANAALGKQMAPIIVVEAVSQTLLRASFSNEGGHLSGPGVGVLSAVLNNGYGFASGTSMATPHLAGLATQVIALDPTFPRPTISTNPMLELMGANTVTTAGAADMPDAFATALDIDRVQGGDRILRMLLDVDDGSQDGNERENKLGAVVTDEDFDGDGELGDGQINMADFRRFRDALLLTEGSSTLALDGPAAHPKKDLNGDGQSAAPASENIFPRFDFNGDGIVDRSSRRQMRGALAGQNLTDLEVLMSRFADSLYTPAGLPLLLDTGDAHFYAQECALLPGVTDIQVQVRDAQTQALIQGRIIPASQPVATLVVPALPNGALLQVRALQADLTTVVATDEMTAPFPLGGDVHFTAQCADLSITNTASLALPMGNTANFTFRVADYDFVTGTETPLAGADVTLTATGGTVTPASTVTDGSGQFTVAVTRSGSANVVLTVKASRLDGPFRFVNFVIGNVSSLSIATEYVPGGAELLPYTGAQLTAVGASGPVSWTIASGSLPSGLGMSATGFISGTPTAGSAGSYPFTVQASAGGQTAQKALSIGIGRSTRWIGGWTGTITRAGITIPLTFLISQAETLSGLRYYFISTPFGCEITFTSPNTIVGTACAGGGPGLNPLSITGDGFNLTGTVGTATFTAIKTF